MGRARLLLLDLLPAGFDLMITTSEQQGQRPDGVWRLIEPSGGERLIVVEARASLNPRDIGQMLDQLPVVSRTERDPVTLVVVPWLSARSRELLEARNCSYLDLTGNVFLRIDRPVVFVRTQGAERNPEPTPRTPTRLAGPKARRLVRLMADFSPPFRLTDLARVAGLNRGYVSSLLQALDEQAIVERGRRGVVVDVDWAALLEMAAGAYELLRTNSSSFFVAPEGATALFERLNDPSAPAVTVTGSFAAYSIAPVVPPSQLVLYTEDPSRFRSFGRLLQVERGADVVLLVPEDRSQLERPQVVSAQRQAGMSQLVLDCLGGNGRLPEEGRALLDWMSERESQWRLRELP